MSQFIWSSWTGKFNLGEISVTVATAGGRLERGTNNFGVDGKVLYIISGGGYRHVYFRAHGTQPLRPLYSLIVFKLYSIYKCNSVFPIKRLLPTLPQNTMLGATLLDCYLLFPYVVTYFKLS